MFMCSSGGFEDFVQSGPTFGIEEHGTLISDLALLARPLPVRKHILLHKHTLTHCSTTTTSASTSMYNDIMQSF